MSRSTTFDPKNHISYKPRIINTTDLGADPDDEQSLVRFFVSSNEYDVEGLIVTTSCWKLSQHSTAMLDKIIDAYGKALPNLEAHADGFPSVEYLKSITTMGQPGFGMPDVGADKDSPGSELIIAAVDKDDPRPVWVTFWGGGNTLAQAIWKVQHTRTPEEFNDFISKLRVYDVLGQDDSGAWMTKNFPELFYIRAKNLIYGWQPSEDWVRTHIQSHGALGDVYPDKEWTYEGDTPAFLYLYPNGLTHPDHVDWGSWGGRFDIHKKAGIRGMTESKQLDAEPSYDPYFLYSDAPEGGDSMRRWKNSIENDFEARMDWSITSNYSEANHHPVAVLNGDTSKQVLEMSASAGSHVNLSAEGSSDPDGHELFFSWWCYREPSSYKGTVTILNSDSVSATVEIPSDASGKTIHVILEIHDNGAPNLYAYRRAIIHVE